MTPWNRLQRSCRKLQCFHISRNPRGGHTCFREIPSISNTKFLIRTGTLTCLLRKCDFEKEFPLFEDILFHPVQLIEFRQWHGPQAIGANQVYLCIQHHQRGSNVTLVSGDTQRVLVWNHSAICTGSTIGFVTPLNRAAPIFALIVPETTGVKAKVATQRCISSNQ